MPRDFFIGHAGRIVAQNLATPEVSWTWLISVSGHAE